MAGRTAPQWTRVYMDGYDLSGYARTIGPLLASYESADMTVMADTVNSWVSNRANFSIGTLNTILDNTATSGSHTLLKTPALARRMMVPLGIGAAPALGDPTFCGAFDQTSYEGTEDAGAVVANANFGGWDKTVTLSYDIPWGWLLCPKNSVGVNAANGIAQGSCTGGWFMYQLFSFTGAGTITFSLQDSLLVGGAYANVTDGVTGAISTATIPSCGIWALPRAQAVRAFVRYQVAFGGATTAVNMAFAWMPNVHAY